jgi:ribosome-associated translation inhibitor RaiA
MDIQSRGFPLTAALLEHTERRLQFQLTRATHRIERVMVRLGDINGPRGGEDKFCKVQVVLSRSRSVVIEEGGGDLYAVIERAAERTGRNVARSLARERQHIRSAVPESIDFPEDIHTPVSREIRSTQEAA